MLAGVESLYSVGDWVDLTCSTPPARPPPVLTFTINGRPVRAPIVHVRAPMVHVGARIVMCSSQYRLLCEFPARCCPEAFHATFIHNIQREEEDRIGWRRSLGTTVSTTTTTYHHHYPLNSYRAIGRGGKKGGRTSETQSHSHSCSFSSQQVI